MNKMRSVLRSQSTTTVNCRSARCFRSTNCQTIMPVPGVPMNSSKLQAAPVRQERAFVNGYGIPDNTARHSTSA